MTNIWGSILDLLYPLFCVGCSHDGKLLCVDCIQLLSIQNSESNFIDHKFSSQINELGDNLDGLLYVTAYEPHNLAGKLVHSLKYDFVSDLAPIIASFMAKAFLQSSLFQQDSALCFVPLHKKRFKWRGFNQSELLAKGLGELLHLSVLELLQRVTFSRPQMELGKEERLSNVENAFVLSEYYRNASFDESCVPVNKSLIQIPELIFLVDDVATTNNTLNACAKVLKSVGVQRVIGFVFAKAM